MVCRFILSLTKETMHAINIRPFDQLRVTVLNVIRPFDQLRVTVLNEIHPSTSSGVTVIMFGINRLNKMGRAQ
jgi:hypothetical protein